MGKHIWFNGRQIVNSKMIDESLRQHYTRLFNIKPTIDTSKPRHFQPQKRVKKKRASSARVARESTLTRSRDSLCTKERPRQQDILGVYSSDNEEQSESFPAPTTQPRGVMNNSHVLINNYGNSMAGPSFDQKAISDRIDQFFSEVSQKEMELKNNYQQKQMRIDARKRPTWNRSISYQSSFESRPSTWKNSSARPASLSRDLSHRSSRTSNDKCNKRSQRTNSSLEARNRPNTASVSKVSPQMKPRIRPASAKPSTSGPNKTNNAKRKQLNSRPQSKNNTRPASAAVSHLSLVPDVESRVRYSRNYQAPRRKKIVKEEQQIPVKTSEAHIIEEYEADFDSDEYEEVNIINTETNDEETEIDNHREAWLVEQAERGRARQRALMMRSENTKVSGNTKHRNEISFREKESSRDSAYGFSADSRMPTREPTPDSRMQSSQYKRILGTLKPKKEILKVHIKEGTKKDQSEYENSDSHLKFLTDVTNDIINRGIFSEKGLRSAINSQVKKKEHKISSIETENLLKELKLQLGIEANTGGQRQIHSNTSEQRSNPKKKNPLPPTPPNRKMLHNIRELTKKKTNEDKLLDDMSERQISDLLREASLDSDTVNSIMDIITKDRESDKASTDSPKLFNSVNISNFNISFNAGKGTLESSNVNPSSRTAPTQRKAAASPRKARNSESACNNSTVPNQTKNNSISSSTTRIIQKETAMMFSSPTPRSSSLYQPETGEENTDQEEEETKEDYSKEDDRGKSNEAGTGDYSEVDEDICTEDDQQSTSQSESEDNVEEDSEIEEVDEVEEEEE